MGSQLITNFAYIAGFLDGDGSLMFQIKNRSDNQSGWRLMMTICFYQDSRNDIPIQWIKNQLKIGYLSKRKDGITELRINGYKQIYRVISLLIPFIKFKKYQAKAMLKASKILIKTRSNKLSDIQKKEIIDLIMIIQKNNYATRKKKSREELELLIGLTP